MALTVKQGILEGIWQKSGHLLVLAVSAIVCGYAVLVVGTIKADILIQAADASDATIQAVFSQQSEDTYAQTEMIRGDLLRMQRQRASNILGFEETNRLMVEKTEANRLEAKADTIRLESKLNNLQKVLIDEIRKY